MNEDLHTPDDYYVSTDKKALDITFVVNSLLNSYWGSWRTHEIIHESIKNSICFGLFQHAESPLQRDRQIGFARVVTDHSTFSWLSDVFIDERHQNKGLGKFLVDTIVKHPSVANTACYLNTRDAHEFYKKFGFAELKAMRRIPLKSQ